MEDYLTESRRRATDRVVREVQRHYLSQTGTRYSVATIRPMIDFMVLKYGEQVLEDRGEVLLMPNRVEYDELRLMLTGPALRALAKRDKAPVQPPLFEESESRTNGFIKFDPERLEAMVIHLAFRGKNIFPTRLNKLLFYADFSFFARRGRGISGAEYTKLTHGPIFSGYHNTVKQLERKRQIKTFSFMTKGKPAQSIRSKRTYRPSMSILSQEELRVLDWVVKIYDPLSTKDLIAISHREMAYWDTPWRQPIDYCLAEHLESKPPPELFD